MGSGVPLGDWGPCDGAPLLLASSGIGATARVKSRARWTPTDAAVRTRVARVPLEATLPDALRVTRLWTGGGIRGEPARDAAERLACARESRPSPNRAVHSRVALRSASGAAGRGIDVVARGECALREPLVAMDPGATRAFRSVARGLRATVAPSVVANRSLRDAGSRDDHVLLREARSPVGRRRSSTCRSFARRQPCCASWRATTGVLSAGAPWRAKPRSTRSSGTASRCGVRWTRADRTRPRVGDAVVEAASSVTELRIDPGPLEERRDPCARSAAAGAVLRTPRSWIASGACAPSASRSPSPRARRARCTSRSRPSRRLWLAGLRCFATRSSAWSSGARCRRSDRRRSSLSARPRSARAWRSPSPRPAHSWLVRSLRSSRPSLMAWLIRHDTRRRHERVRRALWEVPHTPHGPLGAGLGRRGGGRALLFVVDWLVRCSGARTASCTPRAHLSVALLGGIPSMGSPSAPAPSRW